MKTICDIQPFKSQCVICKKEITDVNNLVVVLTPPDKFGNTDETHICYECYKKFRCRV